MKSINVIKLVDVLAVPHSLTSLPLTALSDIIAEARYHNMLAQLKAVCGQARIWDELPDQFKQHVDAATYSFLNQQRHLSNETDIFIETLQPLNINWVYLKGAAYHLAEFDEFQGRLMSDIDILIPEQHLNRVETVLKEQGWLQTHTNDYDDKFYREWSQEIPPMRHYERQTELDLHFNILPKTLKESPDAQLLINQTVSLPGNPCARILTPPAMVIHSAIHLFYESEFHKGIRDLYDLYLLLTKFSKEATFWDELITLQKQLGNGNSVFYALRYCQCLFGLSIPAYVATFYNNYQPNAVKLIMADFAFKRVFRCMYPPHRLIGHQLAEAILYIRGHLKRMPLRLLIPHLFKKSTRKLITKEEEESLLF